ncbi:hypothetical protein M2137_000690 [Parabacteroides sp. PFB2-10]|uniref:hypothetical protein n=1 Tax=Parabacteroides sp. PFB2-10 TaxID=1742405 RepID=UPI0024767963|nr:hypothetical protein [Parabacteroides sp. PFB2-10]MDH6311931.1 hypothetical protein [Parabacteroides sp. PFB2-10]
MESLIDLGYKSSFWQRSSYKGYTLNYTLNNITVHSAWYYDNYSFCNYNDVPAETFHRQIKPNILNKAGDFSRMVGKNPDVKIVNGKIKLTGTGSFKGKSFNTGLDAIDFFGGF